MDYVCRKYIHAGLCRGTCWYACTCVCNEGIQYIYIYIYTCHSVDESIYTHGERERERKHREGGLCQDMKGCIGTCV